MNKIFSNNHVACHTLPDIYLTSDVANKMTIKIINKILSTKGEGKSEDYEKLKNSVFSASKEGLEKVPWFLKWNFIFDNLEQENWIILYKKYQRVMKEIR